MTAIEIVRWGVLVAAARGKITLTQADAALAALDAGTVRQSQAQGIVNALQTYIAGVVTEAQADQATLTAWFNTLPP